MKKVSILIFTIVICFLCLNNIYARDNNEFSCTYRNKENNNDKYTLTYSTSGNQINVVNCDHNGSSCMTRYKFSFDNDIEVGTSSCPSSFNIVSKDNVEEIKWVGKSNGKYVYSPEWRCLYSDGNYPFYALDIEYWNNKFVIRDVTKYDYLPPVSIIVDALKNLSELINTVKYCKINNCKVSDQLENFSEEPIKQNYNIIDTGVKASDYKNSCPKIKIKFSNDQQISDVIFYKKDDSVTDVMEDHLVEYNSNRTSTTSSELSTTCLDFSNETDCKNSINTSKMACIWKEDKNSSNGGYCNVDNLQYVGCGGASDIPIEIPALISLCVNLLKIATPIILIFISIITLVKALAAQKDDEIKKAQSSLIKKVIAAALVFFVVAIVQFVISKVATTDEEYEPFSDCLNCFLNNDCSVNTYYKTVIGGEDYCTPLGTGETDLCTNLFESE